MSETKNIANAFYHSVIIVGLAVGTTKLMKLGFKNSITPKFNMNLPDIGMATLHVGAAILIKDYLVKRKIIPDDIPMK